MALHGASTQLHRREGEVMESGEFSRNPDPECPYRVADGGEKVFVLLDPSGRAILTADEATDMGMALIRAAHGVEKAAEAAWKARPPPKCNCYMRREDGSHTRKCCSGYGKTGVCPRWTEEDEARWVEGSG